MNMKKNIVDCVFLSLKSEKFNLYLPVIKIQMYSSEEKKTIIRFSLSCSNIKALKNLYRIFFSFR